MHFSKKKQKNKNKKNPLSYKVKGQLWVTGLWSYSAALILKLNYKHLHKYKQGLKT